VVAGSLGATMISFPMEATSGLGKVIGKAMKPTVQASASDTITTIVHLTNRARAEGLLALEEEAKKIEEPFFRKGLELAVDGTDPEALKKTLNTEIIAMKERHKVGAAWTEKAGVYAPTFGIIGAVFGLIGTMGHLSEPEKIGHGIAGAFVATFWGVFLANGIWLPLSAKLKANSAMEVAQVVDRRRHHGYPGRREPPHRRRDVEVARAARRARSNGRIRRPGRRVAGLCDER
jgi:chemotaxis protein MotA